MCTRGSIRHADSQARCVVIMSFFFLLFFCGSFSFAATWHVQPHSEVPLRSGQGTDYRILEMVPDGTKVEMIQEDEFWSKVRTPKGKEGWIIKRYLSNERPLQEVVAALTENNSRLKTREEGVQQELLEVSAARSACAEELKACLAERDDLQAKYQALLQDSADVMLIKRQSEEAAREIEKMRLKLAVVEKENLALQKNRTVFWFLAGGGVLLVGWILGRFAGGSRKRKPSLLV